MFIFKLYTSLLFWIYVQIGTLLLVVFSLPLLLFPNLMRKYVYLPFKFVSRVLFFVTYIRVKIIGLENLPSTRRLVFIANHPGLIDSFFLLAYFPVRFRFVLDEFFFRIPILGYLLKTLGCIGYSEGKKVTLARTIIAALEQNEPLLIFPENPRQGDEIIASFKEGAIGIAKACGATIVPLVIKGSEKVLPKESLIISPGEVKIFVGQPIEAQAIKDVTAKTRELERYFREVFEKGD